MTSDSLFYVVKNNKDIFIAGIIVRKVTMFINNFRELIYELIFIYDLMERCQYVNFMYK